MGDTLVDDGEGIIPRALRQLFESVARHKHENGSVASVRISFLEIYNDECKDLLHQEVSSRDIIIREDKDGKIFFTGAREEAVETVDDALYFLESGNRTRSTAETFMNAASSRSHVRRLSLSTTYISFSREFFRLYSQYRSSFWNIR